MQWAPDIEIEVLRFFVSVRSCTCPGAGITVKEKTLQIRTLSLYLENFFSFSEAIQNTITHFFLWVIQGRSRKYPAMSYKNRAIYWRRYKKHCTQDNDISGPFKIGTLGPHTFLPIAISCPIVFFWILLKVWSLFPFSKGTLIVEKARSRRAPNLGCRGAESPGWFDVLPKKLHKLWCKRQRLFVM